jgi:pheganomycin biosynthesis PGM1-like protein
VTAVDALPIELGLSAEEAQARFDALQEKLVPLWTSIQGMTQDEQTIVVVCSITLEDGNFPASVIQAYEERFLFLLLLLRQPKARLVYVTSQAIHPNIVDYYLGLLPGIIPSHARQRLHLVSPLDGSSRPLSEKLLERPRLLDQLRRLVPNPDRAHLVPFNTTELERDLALALGIPMYGADPKFFPYGTKTGCRRLFEEQGVRHPLGREDLGSMGELAAAIAELRSERPGLEHVIVKLNEGVSGEGNALLELTGLPEGAGQREIEERLRQLQFELPGITYDHYVDMLEKRGAVVEERITGEEFRSPSVQMRVTPLGELEVLSTHDQLLGGPSGQSYLGCIFPADPGYATAITREAVKIGKRLAQEGVIGRFAVDFVAVRSKDGSWEPYAIELNLRKGGTTHPFLTLQFLTDGTYDADTALFTAPSGKQKFFVASDHVESEAYRALTADDLFDLAVRTGLHFDQSRQTGIVFHMMSALGEWGRTGLTAVDESPEAAYALYERAVATLDEEAQKALAERRLP